MILTILVLLNYSAQLYYDNIYEKMDETMFSTYIFGCNNGQLFRNQTFYSSWHRVIFRLLLDANGVTLKNLIQDPNTAQFLMVWQLDLATNAWWQYSNRAPTRCFRFSALASWRETDLIAYSPTPTGHSSEQHGPKSTCKLTCFQSNVCVYDVHQRRWIETDKTVSWRSPAARLLPELTDTGNGSLAMFGGLACDFELLFRYITSQIVTMQFGNSYDDLFIRLGDVFKTYGCTLLNDLWILEMVKDNRNHHPRLEVSWRRVGNKDETKSRRWPNGRIGHTVISVDSKLFVAGGTTSVLMSPDWDNVCSTELWYFDLIEMTWHQVYNSGIETTGILHPARFAESGPEPLVTRLWPLPKTKPIIFTLTFVSMSCNRKDLFRSPLVS